jgi:DNA primase
LALDADAAGEEATRRGLEVAIQVFDRKVVPVPTGRAGRVRYEETVDADIRILRLPQGKDPDEVVKDDPQAWPRLVAEAQPVVDFYFSLISARLDLAQPQGKSTAVEQLLPVIRELAGDKVQQWHYLQRLGRMVRVDERVLAQQLAGLGRGAQVRTQPSPAPPSRPAGLGLEEYYLGLLLASLTQVPVELLVRPQEVTEPQVREVLQVVWEARPEGALTQPDLLSRLDPVLQAYCVELGEKMAALPPIQGGDLVFAYEIAALRVQEEYCRRMLKEYEYLMQEARERGDAQAEAELHERGREMGLVLGSINKAKDQRISDRRQ